MEDKFVYLDSKLFNIGERMFGGRDMELGKVRYCGDSLLYLTDGNVYRCCGVFAGYLGLINDMGETVFAKPVEEWTRGRVNRHAHIEIVEDLTRDKLLHKIVCEGKEILPAPSEPQSGIMFPAMLVGSLSGEFKPIAVYPKATPEAMEYQYKELMRLIDTFKLKKKLSDSFSDMPSEDETSEPPKVSKLKELREKRGISISELAHISGVSTGLIKKYELPENDIGSAKGKVLYALSKALDCTVEEFIE